MARLSAEAVNKKKKDASSQSMIKSTKKYYKFGVLLQIKLPELLFIL